MDAAAMVDLALNWTNVPPQRVCEAQAPMTGDPITIRQMSKENLALTTDGCESAAALAGDLSHRVVHLEHVQAKLHLFNYLKQLVPLINFDNAIRRHSLSELCDIFAQYISNNLITHILIIITHFIQQYT
ncbi:unnamed protein product [Schistosoma curassoni]|uniref:NR LBD domain-containing protein n=1 Tax=Schistosoma curassoni TaxID=6186 RepID=A0A183KM95_9TREM|nr:unnamed protein product [Schistosoma curassoni]